MRAVELQTQATAAENLGVTSGQMVHTLTEPLQETSKEPDVGHTQSAPGSIQSMLSPCTTAASSRFHEGRISGWSLRWPKKGSLI